MIVGLPALIQKKFALLPTNWVTTVSDSSHRRLLAALQLWRAPLFEASGSYEYTKELPLDNTEKDQPAPLSSTAQTVFDAAWNLPITLGDTETTRRRQIAASIRAAADQLVIDPEINSQGGMLLSCKDQLCDIANELDGIAKTET
jgi:hypothetical protein